MPAIVTVDKSPSAEEFPFVWGKIVEQLREAMSEDTFTRWFNGVELAALSDTDATICVPSHIYQLWIESNYLDLLRASFLFVLGRERKIHFAFVASSGTVDGVSLAPPARRKAEPVDEEEQEQEKPARATSYGFNPRNTFEAFVVGATNQYAHAACLAVATQPGKTYNPLFLHGGVGLGKTHLMQAIGQHIHAKKKNAKVLYITSEQFTNDFIDAIQNNTLVKFRRRYRQADVMLIDDVQFLAGKERSQEEFFHTFNSLFDGHKQIVLSSDRPPSEFANLEARLVSRFDWGLTAELQPPDIEMRIAILRKKAQAMEIQLNKETFDYIAERVRGNVRRLEGALNRVASYASLNGTQPSIEKIEHLLKDILLEEARRAVTMEQIQKRVAEHFDVRLADMTSKRRPANIAFPRQIAMYLAREMTKGSLSEIGDAFGGRDHGTVLHAHRLVKERMKQEEKVRQTVGFLEAQLHR
ncbi:MAG: chromosomal replication initiator protein DnaA [Chthoniobacteraceae bacterium]